MSDQPKAVAFDPRDKKQRLGDPKTWKQTKNPALLAIHSQLEVARVAGGSTKINWAAVAEMADAADAEVKASK